ncbi:hypothetical protein SM124_04245 (plasmid) [Bacillus sp. 31A1R]|uniref:DUF2157 domain-containing protein n=1 Tax=Robertmurraya mangrovi TaxID=3098077 RepID=A0ABU5IUX2_9BACI|nr:hypothetical protein [Bacillus sp. 31A1R]MDZ5470958.1 hypothetical protein [Bacillus sp. 31A1R]
MNEARKKIIVNEILYWKKSRMLPEHYCDYLLALYTEGNQPQEIRNEKGNARKSWHVLNYFLLMLIPASVFLIYFTELSIILQMALLSILILSGLVAAIYFSRKGNMYQLSLIVSALILLFSTVELTTKAFPDQIGFLYGALILNCLLWLFSGRKLRLLYFTISGYLGLILLIISIFI